MRVILWRSAGFFLCLVVLPPPSYLGAQRPGQRFDSPLKNFSVIVPDFATRVQKSNTKTDGTVSFLGLFGDLRRIDYAHLEPEALEALATLDSTQKQRAYQQVLQVVLSTSRNELLTQEPVRFDALDMLVALVSFPEGSHLFDAVSGKRLHSVRGLLLFTRGGFQYTLSIEVGDALLRRPEERQAPTEELAKRAIALLGEFYQTIAFR